MNTALDNLLRRYLMEDASLGDPTSDLVPHKQVTAHVIAQSELVVSGIQEAMRLVDLTCLKAVSKAKDGEKVKPGRILMEIKGDSHSILTLERTILNILIEMSSIATETHKLRSLAKEGNPTIQIAATRKTTPGFKTLSKKAVRTGGGDPHRLTLSHMILLKNNHIALFSSVRAAVEKACKDASFTQKIGVEVETPQQAVEAATAGADLILIDNQPPQKIKETSSLLARKGFRNKIILEVSGGISRENAKKYAAAGADVLSTSSILHPPRVQIHLSILP
ncbi:Uncharacterised protein [uncultured archaeon]|nr:Uncharacterised protein [uncultured archaeon]